MFDIQCTFRRVEKKYMLTPEQYRTVLDGIRDRVTPDVHPRYTLCNLYFDTDDFRLARASAEKPVYKEKLRMRSYGPLKSGDNAFVELKKKYDGMVYKRRIVMEADRAAAYLTGRPSGDGSQIGREIDWAMQFYGLKPKAFLSYDREAYSGTEDTELRITFDTNIRCREEDLDLRLGNYGRLLMPEDTILMELKFPGNAPKWLARLLSDHAIFQTSFSKYGTWYKQLVTGARPVKIIQKEVLHCA